MNINLHDLCLFLAIFKFLDPTSIRKHLPIPLFPSPIPDIMDPSFVILPSPTFA